MTRGLYIRTPEIKEKMRLAHVGKKQSKEHSEKISKALKGIKRPNITGENHPRWNSNRKSYYVLHQWVNEKLGKPKKCEYCGNISAKRYDWANKSGKYLKRLNDWIRLCRSCHIKYDDVANKSWVTKRLKDIT